MVARIFISHHNGVLHVDAVEETESGKESAEESFILMDNIPAEAISHKLHVKYKTNQPNRSVSFNSCWVIREYTGGKLFVFHLTHT